MNDQRALPLRESNGEVNAPSWKPVIWVFPAICAIIAGSMGLIRSATALGQHWLPQQVLGTFVLAALTGLPNSITAIRLARHGSGAAVITETFNSNTINILIGLMLPALVIGQGTLSSLTLLDISCLLLLTAVAVVLAAHAGKLTRKQGIVLIGSVFRVCRSLDLDIHERLASPDPREYDVVGSDLKPPCRNYIVHESVWSNMNGKELAPDSLWRLEPICEIGWFMDLIPPNPNIRNTETAP